jgi:hypothetical protein
MCENINHAFCHAAAITGTRFQTTKMMLLRLLLQVLVLLWLSARSRPLLLLQPQQQAHGHNARLQDQTLPCDHHRQGGTVRPVLHSHPHRSHHPQRPQHPHHPTASRYMLMQRSYNGLKQKAGHHVFLKPHFLTRGVVGGARLLIAQHATFSPFSSMTEFMAGGARVLLSQHTSMHLTIHGGCRVPATLRLLPCPFTFHSFTMNSATTLMTSHSACPSLCAAQADHELCDHTDDATQY